MKPQGIFITGTDTGVGKTVVAAAIAAAMRRSGIDAGVMKPIQTGVDRSTAYIVTDADYLKLVSGVDDPIELICPIELRDPLAPSVAARREERAVDVEALRGAYDRLRARHELVIVEGAGGLTVPITDDYLMSDLARDWRLPIVIVSRPGLGAINHCVLTAEFARSRGLQIAGIVIGNWPEEPDLAESTNPREIELHARLPILGYVPRDVQTDVEQGEPGRSVEAVIESGLAMRLYELLGKLTV